MCCGSAQDSNSGLWPRPLMSSNTAHLKMFEEPPVSLKQKRDRNNSCDPHVRLVRSCPAMLPKHKNLSKYSVFKLQANSPFVHHRK